MVHVWLASFTAVLLLLCSCTADELSPFGFRNWHDFLTSTDADQWESRDAQLDKMCRLMDRDDWPSFVPLRQRPSKPEFKLSRIFRYQDQTDRVYHVQRVKRCCRKETHRDRRDCFDEMRQAFLDDYCNTGTNFVCCRYEGRRRYRCFTSGQPENKTISRSSERRHSETCKNTETNEEDKNLLISAMMDLDTEGPECMSNYFPEDNLHLITQEDIEKETCPKQGYEQTGCEARACCKAGAYDGKHKLKPHHCPYYQCRAFYKDFYNEHSDCIDHRFFCGFFFISCCERQYYKQKYNAKLVQDNGV